MLAMTKDERSGDTAEVSSDERLTLSERQRVAEEADAMSVVLAQRAKLGAGRDHKRAESALGRFCQSHKPVRLGNHCFLAGQQYGRIVAAYKAAKEFPSAIRQSPSEVAPELLTEAQRQAQRDHDIMAWQNANAVIRIIHARAPGAMERLCYDERDPLLHDHALIRNCLVKLSLEWGFLVPYQP
jgi:hypothetical protein